jgi:hypothetical protein
MTPFDVAEKYRSLGWTGAIPLPAREKWPPPAGFTGDEGRWPNETDLARWRREGYKTRDDKTGGLLHHDSRPSSARCRPPG